MDKTNQVRKASRVDGKKLDYLLSLRQKDVTLETLQKLFAFTKNSDAMFEPNDTFTLPKGKYYNVEAVTTTVGKYVANMGTIPEKAIGIIGYQNIVFDGGGIGKIDDLMSDLLLMKKIDITVFAEYIDRMQWFSFSIAKFVNSSLSADFLILPDKTQKLKDKLIKDNKKIIESGDPTAYSKLETEMLNSAKDEVKNHPSYQIYASGARGSFNNNYKASTLGRGAVKNLASPKIDISTSSLVDGIPPDELNLYGDLITQASYGRAIGTQEGGLAS